MKLFLSLHVVIFCCVQRSVVGNPLHTIDPSDWDFEPLRTGECFADKCKRPPSFRGPPNNNGPGFDYFGPPRGNKGPGFDYFSPPRGNKGPGFDYFGPPQNNKGPRFRSRSMWQRYIDFNERKTAAHPCNHLADCICRCIKQGELHPSMCHSLC